jgi:hypothetical protein
MNNAELRQLAIKSLNSKQVKSIKKQLCAQFIDKKEKNDCINEFNKSFIKSFMLSHSSKYN